MDVGESSRCKVPRCMTRLAEHHSSTERNRRHERNARIKELYRLVPDAVDKATLETMLERIIDYLKSLLVDVDTFFEECFQGDLPVVQLGASATGEDCSPDAARNA
ncbi:unnamed protein product [Calypogeia fissa]